MIQVAVCDDMYAELEEIVRIIRDYRAQHPDQELSVQSFSSPYALLSAVENGQFHDIYILDIVMPRISGIELGRYIRAHNNACAIIFCTITPEYALESYCVQAQNYLVKPIRRAALIQSLEQAIQRLRHDRAKGISVHTPNGRCFIPFYQIVYLELSNRRIHFHQTTDEVIQSLLLRGSFETALADLLTDPRFLQTHKSFVVNMEHISIQHRGFLTTDTGARIPVSTRKRTQVMDQYFQFLASLRTVSQQPPPFPLESGPEGKTPGHPPEI